MPPAVRLLLPIGLGAVTLVAALVLPAAVVSGEPATGPRPPAGAVPAKLGAEVRAAWIDHDRRIRLAVRADASCRPVVDRVTSTAPARLEVDLAGWNPASCDRGRRVLHVFDLPGPAVAEPGQQVKVYVDGRQTVVPRSAA